MSTHRSKTERDYDVVFFQPGVGALVAREGLPPPGGAEVQILRVAQTLAARGWRVGLIVRGQQGSLPATVDGVRILPIVDLAWRGPAARSVRRLVRISRAVLCVLRVRSAVLVQRSAGRETGMVGLVAKLRGSSFVYSSANVVDFNLALVVHSRVTRALYRLGIRLADQIVVQSSEQQRLCLDRFGRRSALIRSVALPESPRRSPDALVWIGRLDGYKRPEAFVELARRCPEIPCWMIAIPGGADNGRVASRLLSFAEELPNLSLLPPRPHTAMGPLLDQAVAVVNTGLYEGMPNVFLEGWSRGVPALAHHHDPDGVIVREGLGAFADGSDERLASLARELWDGRFDQAEVSARCRAYVTRTHGPAEVAAQWERALGLRTRT